MSASRLTQAQQDRARDIADHLRKAGIYPPSMTTIHHVLVAAQTLDHAILIKGVGAE